MTEPARYVDQYGDSVEAVRWRPDLMPDCGLAIGWLLAARVDFHHPSGSGKTTTLAIRRSNERGEVTAQPGDWIIRRNQPLGGAAFAVMPDAAFTTTHTVDERAYR